MLWIERHRPKSFDELVGKKRAREMLSSYNIQNIPHLIFYGQPGHGKKTLLLSLVAHLYGAAPTTRVRKQEIQAGSKKLEVSYLESNECIEISPSAYDYQDRAVVQGVIKEMVQSRPVLSMFAKTKRSPIRLVVVNNAEELTFEAQAALRRTIEMYSDNFRIILMCNGISRLIDPIRSRCLLVRIPGFSDSEIKENMEAVLKKENEMAPAEVVSSIARDADGNMRRALCMLELYCFNKSEEQPKRKRLDIKNMKLEWEASVESIAAHIRKSQKPETMLSIRKELYELLDSCISPGTILHELTRCLMAGAGYEAASLICKHALVYEERIRFGTKSIYHLEAFVAASMCIFSK
jgi:replication factor C subunit 3/5